MGICELVNQARDLREKAKKAHAASGGAWGKTSGVVFDRSGFGVMVYKTNMSREQAERIADHIVACDPERIASLCDEIERIAMERRDMLVVLDKTREAMNRNRGVTPSPHAP